jgi:tetratricopeptide (TPR) repeat protein
MPLSETALPDYNIDFSKKSFLIVDDFQGMRTILRDIVRNCGGDIKRISTASNGKEAISALSSSKFDVVLCDFNLGPGKNGQQILEEAKVCELVGPACAWIMVTAEKTSEVVAGAAEYQPDAYLLKPITEAVLRQRLDRIWARKAAFVEIDREVRRHRYDKAIELCNARIAVDKANAGELTRTKGELALASGNLDLARHVYEDVLAVRDIPWAKSGLAKVFIARGDAASARELLEQAIRETPSYLEAHDLLADTLRELGDLDAAIQSLERAAKLSPNSIARQKNLGDISLKLGKADSAERAYRKSVSLGENSVLKTADAYLGLAKACSANANPAEALKVLGQLDKVFDSEDVKLKAMAVEGVVHHQSGNVEKARDIAEALGKRLDAVGAAVLNDGESSLDVAKLLFMAGDTGKAASLLQQQVRNNPENLALHREVKDLFVSARMGEEGERLIESSRREGTEMMNRGVLLTREGRHDDAVVAMREANAALPLNVRVMFNLAYVIINRLAKVGLDAELEKEARSVLTAAHKLAPNQPRYTQLMAALESAVAGPS